MADRVRTVCFGLFPLYAAGYRRSVRLLGELFGLHAWLLLADGVGAMVGLAAPKGNLMTGLAILTGGIAPLVLFVFSVGVAAANAMNLYCGALSTLTFGQTLIPNFSPGPRARTVIALVLFTLSLIGALAGKESFMVNYEAFILLLLYVLVPWTAINLVDYYLVRHGNYDIASFFRRDGGVYGRINTPAVICYGIGILVQLPFIDSPLYVDPSRARWGASIYLGSSG